MKLIQTDNHRTVTCDDCMEELSDEIVEYFGYH